MDIKVEIFFTKIICTKYCTVPCIEHNCEIDLFYCAWYCDRITDEPGIWLFATDFTSRVLWISRQILCLQPLFKNNDKIIAFQSRGFSGWPVF